MDKYDFNTDKILTSDSLYENKVIRSFFQKNVERARMLLLIYKHKPIRKIDIARELGIDGNSIFYWARWMENRRLIIVYNGRDVLISDNHNEMTDKIRKKYKEDTRGTIFDKKKPMLYYCTTRKGEDQIPFCCELLNITCVQNATR